MMGEVSLREFHKMVAELLPHNDHMHSVLLALSRRLESLRETMEDMGSESMAAAKKNLMDCCTKLQGEIQWFQCCHDSDGAGDGGRE